MSRPWSRSGLRVLSILVLVLGLVGGGYLSTERHNQQIASASSVPAGSVAAYESQQQGAEVIAAIPKQPVLDAAQKAAQANAAAVASSAADQAQAAETAARARAAQTASRSKQRTSDSVGPIPTSCSSYTGNRAIGCTLLLADGFALSQMPCLDKMWTRESNWRTTAENPSSHSYGIPQALPASKMAAYGSDYRSNPVPQIKWGLNYIKTRYGSPCSAWTFWQAHNWY